jgi:dihydroxy-acid dehydratase
MNAERFDGMVTFAGCDKSLPGMMMAAARLDVASVFVYAGSTLPGQVDGQDVTIIDAFEAVGACARGLITQERVDQIERAICPGEGACGGMFTANTMATVGEAIGLSLPGSAAPPAVDRRRDAFAVASGAAVVNMIKLGLTTRDILTKRALTSTQAAASLSRSTTKRSPGTRQAASLRGTLRSRSLLPSCGTHRKCSPSTKPGSSLGGQKP